MVGCTGGSAGICIRVEGHLAPAWSDWFEGMVVCSHPDGTTTLSGPIRDQAALQGVLLKVWNLGLALVSVNPIALNQDDHEPAEDKTRDEEFTNGQDG